MSITFYEFSETILVFLYIVSDITQMIYENTENEIVFV